MKGNRSKNYETIPNICAGSVNKAEKKTRGTTARENCGKCGNCGKMNALDGRHAGAFGN